MTHFCWIERLISTLIIRQNLAESSIQMKPAHCNKLLEDDHILAKKVGRFQLEALIGTGGMACVFRGRDTTNQQPVAIKVMDAPLDREADYAQRFLREWKAVAKLNHPHIVNLIDVGNEKGMLYMVMNYVDGADLGKVLNTYQADGAYIDIPDMLRLVQEVANALDYIHSQDIVHRDIKPENVMMDKDGKVILMDFGLALLIEVGTRGVIVGTPHYVAPEQAIWSAQAVPQTDIYSLGVIVFEMLTNRVPFKSKHMMQLIEMHINDTPPAPSDLRTDLSPAVDEILFKALAKQPENRYNTATEFIEALAAVI